MGAESAARLQSEAPAAIDEHHMARAITLAARGRGAVEPNPLVGCVIAHVGEVVGEGYHARFGAAHAEVEAIAAAGERTAGATIYVTLEPCCHQGKTPPCSRAVIASGVKRVVIAMRDPFTAVAGKGIHELETAGIQVEIGLLDSEARKLNAPYLKLLARARPWVIAKWAMTLDGKIAAAGDGDSKWISNERSREIVHALRGRVDAVIVGSKTAALDDPLLTARPPGARVATRIVLDSAASLAVSSKLVQSAHEAPVLIATGTMPTAVNAQRLEKAGCEVLRCGGATRQERLASLLDELGRRKMTNVLVEGGAEAMGVFFDAGEIDEAHVFIAPKLLGGAKSATAIGGEGLAKMSDALKLAQPVWREIDGDLYVSGHVARG